MHTHTCIRPGCGTSYQDSDPDAYYCPPCLKARKDIAAQVDAKLANRPKRDTPSFDEQISSMKTFRGIPIINL